MKIPKTMDAASSKKSHPTNWTPERASTFRFFTHIRLFGLDFLCLGPLVLPNFISVPMSNSRFPLRGRLFNACQSVNRVIGPAFENFWLVISFLIDRMLLHWARTSEANTSL